jgi:hypothetical protein
MTPDLAQAFAVAIRQWHEASRNLEFVSHAYTDAQLQLQQAERDLHELARVVAIMDAPTTTSAVSNQDGPIGTVTMPIVRATPGPSSDGVDAAQFVLEAMRAGRAFGT